MLGLYGFDIYDVFTGKAPIRVAFAYINRLPFEPWSVWRANKLGGPEHLGWTADTYKAADQVDAISVQTVIVANFGSKRKPKMPDPTFRPKVKTDEEVLAEAGSLADFDVTRLINMTGGG